MTALKLYKYSSIDQEYTVDFFKQYLLHYQIFILSQSLIKGKFILEKE